MATTVNYDNLKKGVVSILQSSTTAYGSSTTGNAPDGSNQQYASSEEINNRILQIDGEVCNVIINSMQSPFQSTFIQTSGALSAPKAALPARNGVILSVLTQDGGTQTFASSDVSVLGNSVLVVNHGLVTGQKVQLTTSGALPTGLSLATDYYIIRLTSSTFRFASTQWNAFSGTAVTMSAQGSGTNTITGQYIEGTQANSKDTVTQAYYLTSLFAQSQNGACNFWFIEGDEIYMTSPNCKVVYTDYTLTSSPQAPEPYAFAIIAGTVAKLVKDGSDSGMASYYNAQYQGYLQQIASGSMVLSAIEAYKG